MKEKTKVTENITSGMSEKQLTMKIKDWTQLEEGEPGVVVSIHGGYGLLHRLESLRIRVGKK